MARFYQPRQKQSTMRWDMTVSSDDEGWAHAVGYCGGWKGDPDEAEQKRLNDLFGEGFSKRLQAELEALRPFKDKFHTDGHATSEEASDCYDQYVLDTELEFHDHKNTQKKCLICGTFTTHYALLGHTFSKEYPLCTEHGTRENVQKLRDEEQAKKVARAR